MLPVDVASTVERTSRARGGLDIIAVSKPPRNQANPSTG